ncbi:hypothetical protein [Pseudomonas syringae]|uniref:hypothetical protein n=1 Tax=Pseudomonas syringae TaxID=317 RepID=UPI00041F3E1A|nr:hypothetical protein [Pseudomonas syringae]
MIWIIDDASKTVVSVPLRSDQAKAARNLFMTRVEAEATLAMEISKFARQVGGENERFN